MTDSERPSSTGDRRIELPHDAQTDAPLLCTRLVREVPGRRRVYEAMWNGLAVIAKIFCHPTRSATHLRREVEGLAALHERAIPAPTVLYSGRLADGAHIVVTLRLNADVTLAHAAEADRTDAVPWLDMVLLAMANLHARGVAQRDLHPDNLLISGGTVYLLDPALVRLRRGPVPRRLGLSQVALLLSQFPRLNRTDRRALVENYAAGRGWTVPPTLVQYVERQCIEHTLSRVRRALRKCQRSSTRELHVESTAFEAVFDRAFLGARDPAAVVTQLEALIQAGTPLKTGRTCSLARVAWDDADVVIKRYNHKGMLHAVRHTLKGSRARRHWLHAHRLLMLGVRTPRPLAFIDLRQGPLVVQSYIIVEHIRGGDLRQALRDTAATEPEKQNLVKQVHDLLECLDRYRLTHGDLKHRNFLVRNNEVFLIDLDGMQAHRSELLYAHGRRRDLARFERNWADAPELAARFRTAGNVS